MKETEKERREGEVKTGEREMSQRRKEGWRAELESVRQKETDSERLMAVHVHGPEDDAKLDTWVSCLWIYTNTHHRLTFMIFEKYFH